MIRFLVSLMQTYGIEWRLSIYSKSLKRLILIGLGVIPGTRRMKTLWLQTLTSKYIVAILAFKSHIYGDPIQMELACINERG